MRCQFIIFLLMQWRLILLIILLYACAKDRPLIYNNDNDELTEIIISPFGTEETLDIITWNLQLFPKSYNVTLEYVEKIIKDINVDIIALQEINSYGYFQMLLDNLNCQRLDINNYGECLDILGWALTEQGCKIITGCSTINQLGNDDGELIYSDSLSCIINCSIQWDGYRTNDGSYNLAYIYNSSSIEIEVP